MKILTRAKALAAIMVLAALISVGCDEGGGGGGGGDPGPTTSFTPQDPAPPAVPQAPAAPSDAAGEIIECIKKPTAGSCYEVMVRITWTDNSDNEDGFEIEYFYYMDSNNPYYAEAAADAESADIHTILCSPVGLWAKYYVSAYNDVGDSDYAPPDQPIEIDVFDAQDYCALYPPGS